MTILTSRHSIRKHIRQQRRSLTPFQQKKAAKKLSLQLDLFFSQRHIFGKNSHTASTHSVSMATYLAGDGEINPDYFQLKSRLLKYVNIDFYFPIIQKDNSLRFGLKSNGFLPRKNKYKIPEPAKVLSKSVKQLDVVLMPLVAATSTGIRLGMGGGFYDRTLAKLSGYGRRPLLVGIAHELQILETIPSETWDQNLDYVVTDERVIRCRGCRKSVCAQLLLRHPL